MKSQTLFGIPFLILLLSACGGDGNSSSNNSAPPPPNVPITQSNSKAVAQAAYRGSRDLDGMEFRDGDSTSTLPVVSDIPHFLSTHIYSFTPAPKEEGQQRLDSCSFGGDVDVVDIGNNRLSVTFDNCTAVSGITLNGNVTLGGSGNFFGDTFSGTLLFTQLSFTYSNLPLTFTIDGSISYIWTTIGTIKSSTETANYTISVNGYSVTVSNYSSSSTYDSSTGVTTENHSYTITSSFIGGSVMVSGSQSFVAFASEPFPRDGVLIITGANGSKLRFTALGSGTPDGLIRLEVDEDGDGFYESTQEISWSQLLS